MKKTEEWKFMSAVIVFNIIFYLQNLSCTIGELSHLVSNPNQVIFFFVYHPKWFNIIECYTMLQSSVNEVLHTQQITITYVYCIRKAIPQKNLLLFGHCQNCHDPPPMGFWTHTRNFNKKKSI